MTTTTFSRIPTNGAVPVSRHADRLNHPTLPVASANNSHFKLAQPSSSTVGISHTPCSSALDPDGPETTRPRELSLSQEISCGPCNFIDSKTIKRQHHTTLQLSKPFIDGQMSALTHSVSFSRSQDFKVNASLQTRGYLSQLAAKMWSNRFLGELQSIKELCGKHFSLDP
ncbi:uncharacterized protein UTRI_01963 [Ustilago trichophora]|uniref:Uncharacterized protein n=1 Tax=Ustilago trichophora TaxID=86804 RepID=A0A5C3DYQ7_9BASI|nr:uncharacterized protein UTRI_01963 [Ustilago trichophora]